MNRRRNNISKSLKDYLVPIVGLFVIIMLIISIFSGGNANEDLQKIETENKVGYSLVLDTPTTESYVEYPGDYKKKIEENLMVYKGEKVIVKDGSVSMSLEGIADLNLSKLGELKFTEDGGLFLYSSDLWVHSQNSINVNLRYANVSVGEDSVLSFSQNEMGSTVYLLSGFAEVRNLEGESTVLAPGQKIGISRLEASKKDLDLQLSKENIDDYFKSTDWFIKNNGAFYLSKIGSDEEETLTGSTQSNLPKINSGIIAFDNLVDESQVSDSSINITGAYTDETIVNITVNGKEATLNKILKTFAFSQVPTNKQENDLVFKAIDDAGDVLEKTLYTVYYSSASAGSTSTGVFPVQNYAVDATKFQFTSPVTGNTYNTSEEFITIRGKVSDSTVTGVKVNGYELRSYNGSTWRYHASTVNENLKDGTNIYEIKYYDANKSLIYTNYFTINKKLPTVKTPVVEEKEETQTFSDEA